MLTTLLLLALAPLTPAAQVVPPSPLAPTTDQAAPDPLARSRDYIEVGELNKAERELQALLADGGADERDVRLLLSELLVLDSRFQEALDILEPLGGDQDAQVLRASGRAYWALADQMRSRGARDEDVWHFYQLARSNLVEAHAASPAGDTQALTDAVTLLLYTFGDHEQAFKLADAACQASPGNGEAHLARGNAGTFLYWNTRGNDDGGEADWTRAVADFTIAAEALPPMRVEPLRQLAWLYEQREQYAEAVAAATEILERDPTADPDVIFGLARRLVDTEQTQLAARALTSIVEHQPRRMALLIRSTDDPVGVAARLQWLAFSLPEKQRGPALDAIMAANPADADTWNNYGLYLRDTGRYEESYAAYERAVSHDDTDPRILNDTGVLLHYYLKRDDERAIELYTKAIQLANEQLADQRIDDELRAYLDLALTDARNNLSRIGKNDRRPR